MPARVSRQKRTLWTIQTEQGTRLARLPKADLDRMVLAVGDWIAVSPGLSEDDLWLVQGVLPRRTKFSRQTPGSRSAEQVVAANVDRIWIVHGLDRELNARSIERYLAVAWESGAQPEVVLSKSDLATDLDQVLATTARSAPGVPIFVVHTLDESGCSDLADTLATGMTIAVLGPSGVGKSSLVNRLAGHEALRTGEVRESDGKGRHTTTHRELIRLESGALLLDTPGMRELGVWHLDTGLGGAFPEIESLVPTCRFRDCGHDSEPGCAVLTAVNSGSVGVARLESYRKLKAEAEYQNRRTDPISKSEALSERKSVMKSLRAHPRYRK